MTFTEDVFGPDQMPATLWERAPFLWTSQRAPWGPEDLQKEGEQAIGRSGEKCGARTIVC